MRIRPWMRRLHLFGVWSLILIAAVALSLWPHPVQASDPPTQPLEPILTLDNQRIGVAHDGIGTFGRTDGSFLMQIPGDGVRHAYLIWAGLGRDGDGILVARDGGTPVRVTHDYVWNNDSFGGQTWGCCGFELSVYAADITSLDIAATGIHQYDITDMAVRQGAVVENWGVSLLVVYDDPTAPQPRDLIIKFGNDGLHFRWSGPLGPNSDVQCVTFPAAPFDRTIAATVIIGGIKDIYRPNGLWGRTGNEAYVDPAQLGGTWTQNLGLIDGVSGITGIGGATEIDGPLDGDKTGNGVDWPFTDNLSDQWDLYPPFAVTLPAGHDWACLQIESANRPEIERGEGTFNLGASIGFVGMIVLMQNEVPEVPAIDIEKATNGEDADNPPGPTIDAGDPVTWTYVVTNTGNVTLTNVAVADDIVGAITCPETTLAPDASMTCTATGVATPGQYANLATVRGETETGTEVTDEDPSHYNGTQVAIDIEKATNGEDADNPPGPTLEVGSVVTWTYVVTNIGNVTLEDVAVTDDRIGPITCPQATLAVDAVMTCTANGIAFGGQYANLGTVTGKSVTTGEEVTDFDPSHYFTQPTGLEGTDEPAAPVQQRVFIPVLRME